eukprot:gene9899-12142_t
MVFLYLLLAASYLVEYEFAGQSLIAYYMFLVTRPVVLVPLIFIIPLYGINDHKTLKYSIFISAAILLNIIGDCIFSFQVSVAGTRLGLIYQEVIMFFNLVFYILSRLFYTIAFIIGIGKKIKLRLFHSIPFYIYAATIVLLVVYSKTIAPVIIKPNNILTNFVDNDGDNNNIVNKFTLFTSTIIQSSNSTSSSSSSSSSPIAISSSQDQSSSSLTDMDPAHFSLIVVYAFIEATLIWRALSLTSSFPGSNPTKLLLWLSVLGSTIFGATDTLMVISSYYYPIKGIFYLTTGGIWLGHALIVFSIPRRMENE